MFYAAEYERELRRTEPSSFRSPEKVTESIRKTQPDYTMFENHRKSLIKHCERSELSLLCEWKKLIKNVKNGQFWRVFESMKLAVKQCYQTGQF